MTKFDVAFDYVIDNEKLLNTDPTDRGGITKYGISERFLKEFCRTWGQFPPELLTAPEPYSYSNPPLDPRKPICIDSFIKNMNIDQAKWIYQKACWRREYDQIENQDICNYILDMTVQHGMHKATELVQRAINANWRYRFIEVDGIFGPDTLREANAHSNGHATMLVFRSCLIAVRESLFRCIVAHDKTQEKFLEGWLKRCYR